MNKQPISWVKTIENLFFLGFFFSIIYVTINSFFDGTLKSFSGMGFFNDIYDPINKKIYYMSVLAILSILTTFFLLVEMLRLFFKLNPFRSEIIEYKTDKIDLSPGSLTTKFKGFFKGIFNSKFANEFLRQYKTNFLAKVFNEYISKLFIIFVYIEMMPYFQKYALFTVPNTAIGWLYAYLMWELTYWLWHFLGHRVRLFWCLHSPHHAPVEMNLTVAWVHFFAEGYYTAAVQVPLLMLLGVSPEMVAIILVIDGTWGTFIHCGENAFQNGRFGILEKFLITPSHHRVHHAKNPLYIDTNFCVLLPFWDWLFGTLQNEKKEVKIEYGITRKTDPTSFVDMYFGECICLYNDLKTTAGITNKFKLLFKPPGWYPNDRQQLATVIRSKFINENPQLAITSRDFILKKLKMKKIIVLLIFISFSLTAQKQPNIIIFMVDDMGWQDCSLPFYSQKTKWNSIYKTPNMERLAAKGTKFTHAYSASVCSPSRVSLMTGMSPLNHHVTNWTLQKNADNDRQSSTIKPPKININGISSLPNIENTVHATTLPMVLQQNGYHTIHVGKAHLGAIGTPGSDPLNLGFDVNIAGHAAGAPHSYLGSDDYGNKDKKNIIWAVPGLEKYWGTDTFLTEALTLEAIDALKKAKETKKPFFLHMSHYAIHSPYKIDARYVPSYLAAGMHPTEAMYAALVEGMDKSLGDIMDYLEDTSEEKNTMILFLSDNGGQSVALRAGEVNTHNSPLRSGKGSAYEGGIRIPMIMKWPNKVQENAINEENVIIEDVFPTILAVAGINKPKTVQVIDGKNILKGNLNNTKREFFWHFPHLWGPPQPYDQPGPLVELHSVIRKGHIKLIYLQASQTFEMYNTQNDISETKNIVFENKKLAIKMAHTLGKALKKSGSKMPTLIAENKSIPYPDESIETFFNKN